jgi:hypothetical protein
MVIDRLQILTFCILMLPFTQLLSFALAVHPSSTPLRHWLLEAWLSDQTASKTVFHLVGVAFFVA